MRSNRLRAVLNDSELKAIAQCGNGVQIQAVSEQVNWYQIADLRTLFEHFPAFLQVQQPVLIAIDKNRGRACLDDCEGRGKGGDRTCENKIPRTASQSPERKFDRI